MPEAEPLNVSRGQSDHLPLLFDDNEVVPSLAPSEFDPMSMLNAGVFAESESTFTAIDPQDFSHFPSNSSPPSLPPPSNAGVSSSR
jgi:hypothetical protein